MPVREGFGIRLGAYLIDFLIMIVVAMGLVMMIFTGSFAIGIGGGAPTTADPGKVQLAGIIGGLIGLAYASLEIFIGRSVGKMALGIIIRSENGAPAPMNQLVMRYAVKYAGSIIGLIVNITGITALGIVGGAANLVIFIGCFMVLGQKRQAIHDMVAKTAVFKVNPVVQQGFQPIMPGNPPPNM